MLRKAERSLLESGRHERKSGQHGLQIAGEHLARAQLLDAAHGAGLESVERKLSARSVGRQLARIQQCLHDEIEGRTRETERALSKLLVQHFQNDVLFSDTLEHAAHELALRRVGLQAVPGRGAADESERAQPRLEHRAKHLGGVLSRDLAGAEKLAENRRRHVGR